MKRSGGLLKFLTVFSFLAFLVFSATAFEDNITVIEPDNSSALTGPVDINATVENNSAIGLKTAVWYTHEGGERIVAENTTFNQSDYNTSDFGEYTSSFGTYNLSDGTYNLTFRTYNASNGARTGELNYTNFTVDNQPNINPVSISENDEIDNSSVEVKAEVSDPNGHEVEYRRYEIKQDGNFIAQREYNESFQASEVLSDGTYNFTFKVAESWTEKTVRKRVENVTFDVPLSVDDGNKSTETSYPTPVTFIGETLSISNSNKSNQFNLTDSAGQVVNSVLGTLSIGTTQTSTDRYTLNNTNETGSSTNTSVDIFSTANDVVGRVDRPSGNVNVDVLYWLNGTNVTDSSKFNLTQSSWPDATGSETVFKMNSSTDEYWLRVENGENTVVKASRGVSSFIGSGVPAPRVNDFQISQGSNITGNVTYDKNKTPVSGLKLELHRQESQYMASRIPYFTAPPNKTTFTNSSGGYKFTGLQSGQREAYFIEVLNYSHTKTPHGSILESTDARVKKPGKEYVNDFNVTSKTENATVTLDAKDKSNLEYAFILENTTAQNSSVYLEAPIEPDQEYDVAVKNQSYQVLAARFNFTGSGSYNVASTNGNVNVNESGDSVTLEFPTLVEINGTVTDNTSSQNPVERATVIYSNKSERKSYTATTNSNGKYSVRVANNTNYTARVVPGFRSSLGSTEKNITVNSTGTVDFNVSEGPYIDGYIKNGSGGVVEDVSVRAWNGSEDSYGSTESESDGYYKIGGLKEDTNYTVFARPPFDSSLPENETTIELNGENTTQNITLTTETYNLTVNLSDENGNSADGTVRLEAFGSEDQEKEVTDVYNFTDLDSGFYRVEAEPDNSTLEEVREYVNVDSDRELDIEFPEFQGISGTVKNQTSQSGVSDVYIYAYNYSERSYDSDRTDSNGDYSLELSENDHEVRLWPGPDSNFKSNTTSISSSEIGGQRNFNLTSGEQLNGTIKTAGGTKLSGYITVYNSSEESYGYTTIDDGQYNITGLDNIDYQAYISPDSSKYNPRTFNIGSSNLTSGRDFQFGENKGPKVRVFVNSTAGPVIPNVTVTLGGEQKKTDSNGEAVFGKRTLKETDVTIGVYKDNYESKSRTVTVKKEKSVVGGTQTIKMWNETFTLENIQGELKDYSFNVTKNGNNVSSASIIARSNKSTSFRSSSDITDSDGLATLQNINPGGYLMAVSDGQDFNSSEVMLNDSNIGSVFEIGEFNVGLEGAE